MMSTGADMLVPSRSAGEQVTAKSGTRMLWLTWTCGVTPGAVTATHGLSWASNCA